MEILALLLLGLIAMLAIVPPIIRGKLDESPLTTSQNFQRSLQEMASSIEPFGGNEAASDRDAAHAAGTDAHVSAVQIRRDRVPARPLRRSRAAVRRSRIVAILAVFASIWGVATLVSGTAWCLVTFAAASFLLVVYWALTLLVPYISSPAHGERRLQATSNPPKSPKRQAM